MFDQPLSAACVDDGHTCPFAFGAALTNPTIAAVLFDLHAQWSTALP